MKITIEPNKLHEIVHSIEELQKLLNAIRKKELTNEDKGKLFILNIKGYTTTGYSGTTRISHTCGYCKKKLQPGYDYNYKLGTGERDYFDKRIYYCDECNSKSNIIHDILDIYETIVTVVHVTDDNTYEVFYK